ncbi:MAG TPA: LLM class flavin-dependent oxidoreductase [Candidatus Methylomirabilis sp.]|nr:LLM class flavin-dependent oxidoreductase [Candidatus Methylomirabilis sp.]
MTAPLQFGVGFLSSNLRETAEQARLADDLGYDLVRIADSQCLFRELYVALTLVALNTSRAKIGPGVTNPITRHPTVTASAIASIDELSGGRAILGIGAGDSAVLNIDESPATSGALREYVLAVRALFRDRRANYRSKTIRLTWAAREVPIWLAAAKPKTLRLAGEIADVVVMGCGFLPESIRASMAYVEEGARAAGRTLDDVEMWVFGPANVADTRDAAVAPLRSAAAATGHFSFGRGLERAGVPPDLVPSVERLSREYRAQHHQGGAGSFNERLVETLGLSDYLTRRFALAGTAEECIEQARAVAATGVRGLMLTIVTPDPRKTIRDLGERVMPAFR